MNWKIKSAVQRGCACVPLVRQPLYLLMQRFCGQLTKGYNYDFLLEEVVRLIQLLPATGSEVVGARVMEVGTGWRIDAPLAFFLCGASKVITCDLSRYLQPQLVMKTVEYICEHPDRMKQIFSPIADGPTIERRIAMLDRASDVETLMQVTGIEYHAPCDCSRMNLPDHSVDLHYSYTVLEHIPPAVLVALLRESNRLISDQGLALHHIDLSDHFAQVDPNISMINFLRFSEPAWSRYSGTPWSYHNRLREFEYRDLYQTALQETIRWEAHIDERSLCTLRNGFPLEAKYQGIPPDSLSTVLLDVISRPTSQPCAVGPDPRNQESSRTFVTNEQPR
jgi:hypothetical protein